jgi:hypothetical protein
VGSIGVGDDWRFNLNGLRLNGGQPLKAAPTVGESF